MVDTTTFAIFTVAYIALTLFLGYIGWKQTKASEDFMLAGRKAHPIIIGLSYGATFISTAAIVGFGGTAAYMGMGLIWLTFLNIAVGIIIAFLVFGKRVRRLGQKLKAVTFPDLMGKRFKSPFMQYTTAFLLLVAMPLYTAAVLIGGAQFLKITLGLDLTTSILIFAIITAVYVVVGGLIAVMYTDAMQGAIMIGGMTFLLFFTYFILGGVTHANQQLTDMSTIIPSLVPKFAPAGLTGWTAFPDLGSNLWLTMVTTIILGVGIGVLAQPQLIVRFMTAKDSKALNRALPIGAIFILITTGIAYTVGPLTNVYFFENNGGQVAMQVAAANRDAIMPAFINAATPDIFIIVFMLVLLSAAMSTLSSIFHTMGTSAGFDLWKHVKMRWFSKGTESEEALAKPSLVATRYGMLIMIVLSVLLALVMPTNIIARATAMFMGLCACAFLPAFTHGLFSKDPSAFAAKASLVFGGVAWFTWTAFFHLAESKELGLSQALFGKASIWGTPWTVVDPLIIALPISIAALGIAWYMDKKTTLLSRSNGRLKEPGTAQ